MRILVAIPHYYHAEAPGPAGMPPHGSTRDPRPRIVALTTGIAALHQLYGPSQCIFDIARKVTRPANGQTAGSVDVVVCTTRGRHLLDHLPLPPGLFEHRPTDAEPPLLGFECHAVLRERLGAYDFYGYLEDDLIARDPWMFLKLAWFGRHVGDDALLLPNRYEVAPGGPALKGYIDGDLDRSFIGQFQDLTDAMELYSEIMNMNIVFRRPLNPHSGCFFLDARQMSRWCSRPDFLDRDTRFVGPLESAATLGILRAFRIYKPAPENGAFLEIEHHGQEFLALLRPAP